MLPLLQLAAGAGAQHRQDRGDPVHPGAVGPQGVREVLALAEDQIALLHQRSRLGGAFWHLGQVLGQDADLDRPEGGLGLRQPRARQRGPERPGQQPLRRQGRQRAALGLKDFGDEGIHLRVGQGGRVLRHLRLVEGAAGEGHGGLGRVDAVVGQQRLRRGAGAHRIEGRHQLVGGAHRQVGGDLDVGVVADHLALADPLGDRSAEALLGGDRHRLAHQPVALVDAVAPVVARHLLARGQGAFGLGHDGLARHRQGQGGAQQGRSGDAGQQGAGEPAQADRLPGWTVRGKRGSGGRNVLGEQTRTLTCGVTAA
ncbi:MAG: hypothetical protein PGN34_21830 [Methylobacterium frigidaeris]